MKAEHSFNTSAFSILFFLIFPLLLFGFRSFSSAQEVNCLICHETLSKGKVVHPALSMGCPSCHSAVDTRDVPHKTTGKAPKGLSLEQPDLCYSCHDKAKFTQKNIHAAIGMGCTGCHNPHSSQNAKLLSSEPPSICFNCHDKAEFSRKNIHMPVQGGMCLQCHSSIHSSKEAALLSKRINAVCSECHPKISKSPHPVKGTKKESHPLSGKKDPQRKDKSFSCTSCHNPHSSDSPNLFRFQATTKYDTCKYCHEY